MIIALAQIHPKSGDIDHNIRLHQDFIQIAVNHHSKAVFFPELSLTGYEPQMADQLAILPEDQRLKIFQELADQYKLLFGIGAPVKYKDGLKICMLIFQPDLPILIYAKQILHHGEKAYFVEGDQQVLIQKEGLKIMPAICFESLQEEHHIEAAATGAHIYLASVAKSASGMERAQNILENMAKKYSINVVLVNSIGYCDDFLSSGQSAIWTSTGEMIVQLDAVNQGLLIYNTETNKASTIKQ